MIAAILAIVAVVLLAVAYVADITTLGWVALAASVAAVVLLLLPTRARGSELAPVEPVEEPAPEPERDPDAEHELEPEPALVPVGASVSTDLVLVIPGRRRYHRLGCALIGDHPVEKLTEEEAQEEEFSACTRCVN